jgi:hypothetical protein
VHAPASLPERWQIKPIAGGVKCYFLQAQEAQRGLPIHGETPIIVLSLQKSSVGLVPNDFSLTVTLNSTEACHIKRTLQDYHKPDVWNLWGWSRLFAAPTSIASTCLIDRFDFDEKSSQIRWSSVTSEGLKAILTVLAALNNRSGLQEMIPDILARVGVVAEAQQSVARLPTIAQAMANR